MKVLLVLVGKTVHPSLQKLTEEYIGRIKYYIPFEVIVIPELKNTKAMTASQQKELEGKEIQKVLKPSDRIVLLDEHGKEMRSVELADFLQKKMNTVQNRLVFIIGGPYGFSEHIHKTAHEKLSLSKLTFSHQMIRLFFTEQIYRAMTILKGEPYHHE